MLLAWLPRDSIPVARKESTHHEDHLDKLRGIVGQAAAEPEEGKYTTEPNISREHLTDGHSCVAAGIVRVLVRLVHHANMHTPHESAL